MLLDLIFNRLFSHGILAILTWQADKWDKERHFQHRQEWTKYYL